MELHSLMDGAVLWFVIATVISNLPEPEPGCNGRWYRALYNTLQQLAANLPAFSRDRKPQ